MTGSRSAAGRPSILVIILDALQARSVSCYGRAMRTTPHLDRLAEKAVRFKPAYTTSTWTIPTHASMLSGLYLSEHRIESVKRDRRFHRSIVTLPAALQKVGYRTAAFSHNRLFDPAHHFDYFDEFHSLAGLPGTHWLLGLAGKTGPESLNSKNRLVRHLEKLSRAQTLFSAMAQWIEAREESEPFFMMANVINIHYSWVVAIRTLLRRRLINPGRLLDPEFTRLQSWKFNSKRRVVTDEHRRVWRKLYEGAICHVDRELGRFLERLRRWRGWKDLIVVVTSDHGEMLGEYRGFVGHMLTLHDDILHVPLIVRHPDSTERLEVEGVVQTLDLYSSAIEWTGVKDDTIPPAQLRRSSFSQAVECHGDPAGYAFAEEDYTDSYSVIPGMLKTNPRLDPLTFPRQQVAVHSATHKYTWNDDRPGTFYALENDPDEKQNLLSESYESPILDDMRLALVDWRSHLEFFPPEPVHGLEELDVETLGRLRALGYVA